MSLSNCRFFVLALTLLLLSPFCGIAAPPDAAAVPAVPTELSSSSYLFEVVRYLYRWHLDEDEVAKLVASKTSVFWIRPLHPQLDPGDKSQFADIVLPQLGLTVKVKKADYTVPELGTRVESRNFRITKVIRGDSPSQMPPDYAAVPVDMNQLRDYLFRTRNKNDYPDAALIKRLRLALREQILEEGGAATNLLGMEKILYIAPLSPVANEVWAFWQTGHRLIYFGSDIDLSNPAVWQHQTLSVRVYNLDEQVIVSHEEAPGSNRFLTRSEVGRALFNCILLGQRLTLPSSTGSNPTNSQTPN